MGPLRYRPQELPNLNAQEMADALIEINQMSVSDKSHLDLSNPEVVEQLQQKCRQFSRCDFVPGPLLDAIEQGKWAALDEFDTSTHLLQSELHNLLDGTGEIRIEERSDPVKIHPNFRLFLTGNGTKFGRKKLKDTILDRVTMISFDAWPQKATLEFIERKFGNAIPRDLVGYLVAIHTRFSQLASKNLSKEIGDVFFTPRHLQAVAKQFIAFRGQVLSDRALMAREIMDVYTSPLWDDNKRSELASMVISAFGEHSHDIGRELDSFYKNIKMQITETHLTIGDVVLEKRNLSTPNVPKGDELIYYSPRTIATLYHLARCKKVGRPALLVGDRGAGKTSIVREFCRILGDQLYQQPFSRFTNLTKVIASFGPNGIKPQSFMQATDINGHGGTLCFDEFNLAPESIKSFFNEYFNGAHEIILPQMGANVWQIHPDNFAVICMNPNIKEKYSDAEGLDAPLLSRLAVHKVSDPSHSELLDITCYKVEKLKNSIMSSYEHYVFDFEEMTSEFSFAAQAIARYQQYFRTLLNQKSISYKNASNGLSTQFNIKIDGATIPELGNRSIDKAIDKYSGEIKRQLIEVLEGHDVQKFKPIIDWRTAILTTLKNQYIISLPNESGARTVAESLAESVVDGIRKTMETV